MNGFLYFLPDARGNARDNLVTYGLEHIADPEDKLHGRDIVSGVGGKPGLLVGNSSNFPDVEVVKFSEALDFQPFPKPHAEKQAYCCMVGDPHPNALLRQQPVDGEWVMLADGNRWQIPIARKASETGSYCNLPQTSGLDEETGELRFDQVDKRYVPLWGHVTRYQESLSLALEKPNPDGSVDFNFQIEDVESFFTAVFSCNYRVSLRELTMLNVITSDGLLQKVMNVLVDDAGWNRLKKNQGQGTGNG